VAGLSNAQERDSCLNAVADPSPGALGNDPIGIEIVVSVDFPLKLGDDFLPGDHASECCLLKAMMVYWTHGQQLSLRCLMKKKISALLVQQRH
jgi:hypothetical protein